MALSAADITGGINSIGNAIGSHYAAAGNRALAGGYGASADLYGKSIKSAEKSADITRESTQIQLLQQERNIYKIISGQQADVAGAGFMASGSALDLLADSTAQGDLSQMLLKKQGKLQAEGYEMQADSFRAQREMALAQEASANLAAEGSDMATIISGISAVSRFALPMMI